MVCHNPNKLPFCRQKLHDAVCDLQNQSVDVFGKFPPTVVAFVVDVYKIAPSHTPAIAISRALKDRPSRAGQ